MPAQPPPPPHHAVALCNHCIKYLNTYLSGVCARARGTTTNETCIIQIKIVYENRLVRILCPGRLISDTNRLFRVTTLT